ncbi:MAG: NADH-quinone oxidoreductase subunit L [Syntrophomonadaceae bacterium]|jgi:NADH-quinone oxidoreductase subunit L|nr:NADH-quinone oxidoreductase subunit L [Bacillota bacterium]NLM87187.1 NADH-quinone oxidoreductase subunit L [Syntrophomonadaceae bacterium]HAA10064.1 NADH-quinone oxidoreductase subunit L [Syntrophomonas sp.]HQD91249.1 NADH-quinone oxidoreductase subunit L [Syntrophomonadaceae bacterium]
MFAWSLELAWLIVLLPFAAFALIGLFLHRWPRLSASVSILAIGLSFALSVLVAAHVFLGGMQETFEISMRWLAMPGLNVDMGLLIDGLTAVMLIVVTLVALLVQVYSLGYMHGDPGFSSYYAYQSVFAGSMLGLVLANNFGQLFVFWELVGLASYLLIGFWFGRHSAKNAAVKAFVTNRVGDFGLLLGILFLQIIFGTLNFNGLAGEIAGYTNTAVLIAISILLLAGPIGKSAQFPLHVWLPDAMEGPTPVSALIHAATMVAAGVYLIARAFFIFSSTPEAMTLIAVIGGFTALFAATIALVQNDIKRILAYSTLSQLGYMVMAMGIGAMTAGMFHLMTHAFFKSLLFLGAGSVIHAMADEQDIWKMGRLKDKMPITTWTFVIGALALAGIPPLSGFWSKDEILLSAFAGGHIVLYLLGTLVAFMTAFYMFRLIFVAFFGTNKGGEEAHESSAVMTVPLIILAVLAVVAGFVGSPVMNYAFGHFVTYPGAVHYEPNTVVMVISGLVAIAGIVLAWAIYQKQLISHLALRQRFKVIYDLLYHKYYIDEIYQWLGERFVYGTAKVLFWFDIYVVNGIVNGIAALTGGAGRVLRYTETGQVQTYAAYMLVGVIVIVGLVMIAGFTLLI